MKIEMIPVTKPYLPPLNEYNKYIADVWGRHWLTNNGPLTQQLEKNLQDFVGNPHLAFCANGTIALQIAIKALGLYGEIITTPFSYVASANSILWGNCVPVFVDIRDDDFCINADLIEAQITPMTQAILAVHVYGYPCDIESIERIALKYKLKVIYDGAHAFGVSWNGKSLLSYGDISTCSFHATKLFHTVEGGAVICNDGELFSKLVSYRQFGHEGDKYYSIGINAKNSELHAAMGLCNLPHVPEIIARRKELSDLYDECLDLGAGLMKPSSRQSINYNYAYYPVVFSSEEKLLQVRQLLHSKDIFPRRYFYPSLNTLPFLHPKPCPVSESIASRVLALPLFYQLEDLEVKLIANLVNAALRT